jgi:hypothetical protein
LSGAGASPPAARFHLPPHRFPESSPTLRSHPSPPTSQCGRELDCYREGRGGFERSDADDPHDAAIFGSYFRLATPGAGNRREAEPVARSADN